MNTKLLMTISAVTMAVTGLILSFSPNELIRYFNAEHGTIFETLTLQILGALYFSFAMINWTAKANLIGGIYARPIAIGNMSHFTIGSLALIKFFLSTHIMSILIISLVYTAFAICFTIIFFRHPVSERIPNNAG